MRANCWYGKTTMRVEEVPDPQILNQRDAIVKISSTAICGSDLHLYNGFIPTMQRGDILGHEFMGEVVEVGREVNNLKIGDRVVVPFPIACGNCFFCKTEMFSLCENSNPERVDGREDVWSCAGGNLWLFTFDRRLRRRPGGICARAVCGRRTDQSSRII